MKPTVAANQAHENAGPGGNGAPGGGAGSVNIPISREYVSGGYGSPQKHQPAQQQPQFQGSQPAYGSPRQQFQPHQQMPPNQHFQVSGLSILWAAEGGEEMAGGAIAKRTESPKVGAWQDQPVQARRADPDRSDARAYYVHIRMRIIVFVVSCQCGNSIIVELL